MGLENYKKMLSGLKFTTLVVLLIFAFTLFGCGSAEQTTTTDQQEPAVAPTPAPAVTQAQPQEIEKAKTEEQTDNVLSSFLSSDELKADSESFKQPVQISSSSSVQLAQYEKQITDLRSENAGIKQRNIKLEEDNRLLTARLNDTETKLAAEKDRSEKMTASAAIPSVAAAASESSVPVITPGSYDEALKAFKAKKYDEALSGFQAVASSKDASDDLAGNAKYWIGETHFAKKEYKAALEDFQAVLKLKHSLKKGDAQFMLGQTYERLGSKAKAKAAYEKVVKEYPLSKNVKRAKQRWAKL